MLTQFVIATILYCPGVSLKAMNAGVSAYYTSVILGYNPKPVLTVIDLTKPADTRRTCVYDMITGQVVLYTYTAHGISSGFPLGTKFSNKPESNQSSLGVFMTKDTYQGIKGYSMRITGLETGFNDQVAARHIVIHPLALNFTHYFTLGCFGFVETVAKQFINLTKNGSIVVAYYPDKRWLSMSIFLQLARVF